MTPAKDKELQLFAVGIREDILKSIYSARTGHPGGSLSIADYCTYLYREEMHVDPANPDDPVRDRFVLSKGHGAPALYATLAHCGFFPREELLTLRHIGSRLQGHPNMNLTPGVDMTTGSLGQGISAAAGMAQGAKFRGLDLNVYALLGDGELDEGQVWEAIMFASHYQLDRLCIAVDVNNLQIDGRTKDVMRVDPLAEKFAAFGCHVAAIDGHSFPELERAFDAFHRAKGSGKPTVILMHTVKGKGVSFMEDQVGWHGACPTEEQLQRSLAELAEARRQIEEESSWRN